MSNFLEHEGIPQHINLNMVASPKLIKLFCHASLCFPTPLSHNLCKRKLNHGQTIWKKTEMLVGTWWEPIGNFEHIKNKENSLSPTPFEPQKEKIYV
jgi:hypothetical protein